MQIAARPDADLSPFDENGMELHGNSLPDAIISPSSADDIEPVVGSVRRQSRSLQLNFMAITLSSVVVILLVFFTYLENSHYQDASNGIDKKIVRMIDGGGILLAEATARKDTKGLLLLLAPVLGDPDVVSVAVTLMDGERLSEQGKHMDDIETYMVFRRAITQMVNGEPAQIGWVHVGITHFRIDEELQSRLLTDIILAVLILFAIVVSSFQSLRMTVMQPLRKLLSAIEGWEIDDDHKPVAYGHADEFGQLITAFNQMQQRQQYYQHSLRIARDTAESADQAKTAFLAIIGHELRTPLNAIIGFSDLIGQKMGDTDKVEYGTYLDHINDSGNALLNMVNDILEITHAQAGRLRLVEEPLLLRNLVDQTIAQCTDAMDGETASVENTIPASLPQLRADPVRLGRMVFHLISNALRFTPPEGKIRVDAAIGDDGLCIQVVDTGCGIPEDRLSDLQQPFTQLSTDWTHHSEGAGLGLTYVRQIAQRLGGAFAIESKVGKGTTATVRLPPNARR